jgi:hypothetical protein
MRWLEQLDLSKNSRRDVKSYVSTKVSDDQKLMIGDVYSILKLQLTLVNEYSVYLT